MNQLRRKLITIFFEEITTFGGTMTYATILLFSLALQQWSLALKLLFGFLFTMMVIVVIRSLYFKNRPLKQEYHNFIEKMDASAFPSWHTARIVFTALIFIYWLNQLYLTLIFTFIAISVMYSRIYLKRHDFYDILGGVILGGITFWITTLW